MQDEQQPGLVGFSAEIVSAYVAKNHIQTSEISQLIASVHDALRNVAKPAPQPEKHEPPVPINKTIRPDYIISLEDGRRYKSLKRHLSSRGLTPEQYRQKWGLRPDYPMVAANYAKTRSELAKAIGLGQKRKGRKRAAKKDAAA
jgi:predicted transcriptional regulator